jgi:ribosomal protein S18 acetylase RimI-like enzyme
MSVEIIGPLRNQATRCEPIMRSLPDWFGIEEAIVNYIAEIDQLPTWVAYQAGKPVGFLALKVHTAYAAELYIIALSKAVHRQGIGRSLVAEAEAYLLGQGIEYFHLKTLAPSHPAPEYAKTRAFHEVMGFRPLEELTAIWGEENPCLLMAKKLEKSVNEQSILNE